MTASTQTALVCASIIAALAIMAAPGAASAQGQAGIYPTLGPADAKVTIVIFSDFQCPFCKRAAPTVHQLSREYPADVRFIFVNQPLSFHKQAAPAARAGLAAHRQGAFWPMHDKMMANQNQLRRAAYLKWARELGLNVQRFARDMASMAITDRIERDRGLAAALRMTGTPGFLINGRKLSGAHPVAKFRTLIDDELASCQHAVSTGLEGDALHADRVRRNNAAIATTYIKHMIDLERPPLPKPAPRRARRAISKTRWRLQHRQTDGVFGGKNPLVTVVVFTDYECPFCRRVEPTLAALVDRYGADLQVRIKHYPLSFHRNAKLAAKSAICAQKQGKFAAMHNDLFANQRSLKRAQIIARAAKLGLNLKRLSRCLDSSSATAALAQHQADVRMAGVRGTPNSFVNGRKIGGAMPFSTFEAVVKEELAIARGMIKAHMTNRANLHGVLQKRARSAVVGPSLNGPKVTFQTAGRPFLGNAAAKQAAVVVFYELACPFCLRLAPHLDDLVSLRPDVKIALLSYPLSSTCNAKVSIDMHPAACPAARWAEAAHNQGKFAAFLKAAHAHGTFRVPHQRSSKKRAARLREKFRSVANDAGLNVRRAARYARSSRASDAVTGDVRQAVNAKVKGTPTIFVNGQLYKGPRTAESIASLIPPPPLGWKKPKKAAGEPTVRKKKKRRRRHRKRK